MVVQLGPSPAEQDRLYLPYAEEIDAILRQGYSSRLGYHGPPHHDQTVDESLANREIMIGGGIEGVPGVFHTWMAAGGHDFGFEDFYLLGLNKYFASPEHYHMYMTSTVLKQFGVDAQTIAGIVDDQLPTKAGEPCKTPGSLGLVLGDLANASLEDRTVMKLDTQKLEAEYRGLKDPEITELGFKALSIGLLATYYVINTNNPGLLRQIPELAAKRNQLGINTAHLYKDTLVDFGKQTAERVLGLPREMAESAMSMLGIQKPGPGEN